MIRRLWETWKSFARDMGDFQSRLILGLLYFFVVTPFGIGVRLFKNPFHRNPGVKASYWTPQKEKADSLEEAQKQF